MKQGRKAWLSGLLVIPGGCLVSAAKDVCRTLGRRAVGGAAWVEQCVVEEQVEAGKLSSKETGSIIDAREVDHNQAACGLDFERTSTRKISVSILDHTVRAGGHVIVGVVREMNITSI